MAHLHEAAQAADLTLTPAQIDAIEAVLPLGFASGDRYSEAQWKGQERYC